MDTEARDKSAGLYSQFDAAICHHTALGGCQASSTNLEITSKLHAPTTFRTGVCSVTNCERGYAESRIIENTNVRAHKQCIQKLWRLLLSLLRRYTAHILLCRPLNQRERESRKMKVGEARKYRERNSTLTGWLLSTHLMIHCLTCGSSVVYVLNSLLLLFAEMQQLRTRAAEGVCNTAR